MKNTLQRYGLFRYMQEFLLIFCMKTMLFNIKRHCVCSCLHFGALNSKYSKKESDKILFLIPEKALSLLPTFHAYTMLLGESSPHIEGNMQEAHADAGRISRWAVLGDWKV